MRPIRFLVLSCGVWALCTAGPATRLVEAAKTQIGITLKYDPSYRRLTYPGGDVPMERGVCTDVIIRAYRKLGIDLQVLLHKDMVKAWSSYLVPRDQKKPDTSIDHRRVHNLARYLQRHGQVIPNVRDVRIYLPGDIVIWHLGMGVLHIGIVSDKKSKEGTPLIIHNIGQGAREEDILLAYAITGHYRFFHDVN